MALPTARRHSLLLVFPTTSTALMHGSIGELTALVRLARSLPRSRFRLTYGEFLRDPRDPSPRVDALLARLHGRALTVLGGDRVAGVSLLSARTAPDAVVLSSFRAFFQFPQLPGLIAAQLAHWQANGIRVVSLDPCGDSFVSPIPPGVEVLVPRPFTYVPPPLPRQHLVAALLRRPRAATGDRWLWTAAPWMQRFARYRAAERIAFAGLSKLGVPVSVLSPLDPSLSGLRHPQVVDGDLDYAALDAVLVRHRVVITANFRSVLAARAAALGVPIVLVDPERLPAAGSGFDPQTDDLLAACASQTPDPGPMPCEWHSLSCTSSKETIASFRHLQAQLPALADRQRQLAQDYVRQTTVQSWFESFLQIGPPVAPGDRRAVAGR